VLNKLGAHYEFKIAWSENRIKGLGFDDSDSAKQPAGECRKKPLEQLEPYLRWTNGLTWKRRKLQWD